MNPPPDFNRLARLYRWMEWLSFGPWLMQCRCAFLSEMLASRRSLVLGDGDGRFIARLLAANPAVRFDAIDASPAMLKALIGQAGRESPRVVTVLADARTWQPNGTCADCQGNQTYDLVVTHFFLDCLTSEEVRALAATVRAAISPSAKWVISEFAAPENRFGRWVAQPIVWALYCVFGWLTGLKIRRLPEYAAALGQAGFYLGRRRVWLGGLLVSDLWRPTPADSIAESGLSRH